MRRWHASTRDGPGCLLISIRQVGRGIIAAPSARPSRPRAMRHREFYLTTARTAPDLKVACVSWGGAVCRVPQRRKSNRLNIIGQTQYLAGDCRIKVRDPAGPQIQGPGSQDQVVHGNGDIHVGVDLAVHAHPCLVRNRAGTDDQWRLREPIAGIDALQLGLPALGGDHDEAEGLPVGSSRRQECRLQHLLQLFLFHRDGL